MVKEAVLGMATNAVSEFIPTAQGGIFFHLKDRRAPSSEDFEKDKAQIEEQLLERNREALFVDWVNALMRKERVDYKRKPRAQQPEAPVEETEPVESPAPATTPAPSPSPN